MAITRMFNNVYYFDEARSMLWVLPPKNASTSIKAALGCRQWISREEATRLNQHFTVGVIRHPLQRAADGLLTVCRMTMPIEEQLRVFFNNSHIRPQAPAFDGLRVDFWLRFEHLEKDWQRLAGLKDLPELVHVNQTTAALPDLSGFESLYQKDLELWNAVNDRI